MDKLGIAERQFLYEMGYTMQGMKPGSFMHHLIQCFIRADRENTAKLSLVFPDYGNTNTLWQTGELLKKYNIEVE